MVDIGEMIARIEHRVSEKKEFAYTILRQNPGVHCPGASVAVAVADELQEIADMLRGEVLADEERSK